MPLPIRAARWLGWPDPRQLALSGLTGLLLLVYAWLHLLPLLAAQAPRADDFQDYLFAAQQLATGGDPYANFIRNHVPYDWSLSSGYLYPPAFAVFLIPFTWIANDLAVRLWLVLIQGCVLLSLMMVYRVIGRPGRGETLCLVAVLATFFPLANSVLAGAMNTLLLLLLAAAWMAWQRRADVAAGVLVGVAAVFKLFPLALLPYLAWRRHLRLLAAVAMTGLAGIGLGLLATSIEHNIYYFREMLPHLAAGTGYRENQSLAGFTARLCQPSTADLGGSADWCGRLLDWPLVLAVLAAVLAATSRSNRSGLEFALAVCALPLVSSVSWSFHLVVLILPIALLLRQVFLGQLSRWQIRLLLLAWACFSVGPALHYLWIVHPLSNWALPLDWIRIGLTRLVGEAYLMGSLILFASVWLALRKEREASALEHSTSIAA